MSHEGPPEQTPPLSESTEIEARPSLELPVDFMESPCDPDLLRQALITQREHILGTIEEQYQEALRNFPGHKDIFRPPFEVARLHSKRKGALTPEGLDNGTAIHKDITEIKERYHPYWRAVEESGFVPEVQSTTEGFMYGGVILMLREPEPN
jgi:hypothetical protein